MGLTQAIIIAVIFTGAIIVLGVAAARKITQAWENNWREAGRLLNLTYNRKERRLVGVVSQSPVSVFLKQDESGPDKKRQITAAYADCHPGYGKLQGLYVAPRGLGAMIPPKLREQSFLTGDERFDEVFIAAGAPRNLALACLPTQTRESLLRLILGTLHFDPQGGMVCEVGERITATPHLTAMVMAAAAASQGLFKALAEPGDEPPPKPAGGEL